MLWNIVWSGITRTTRVNVALGAGVIALISCAFLALLMAG